MTDTYDAVERMRGILTARADTFINEDLQVFSDVLDELVRARAEIARLAKFEEMSAEIDELMEDMDFGDDEHEDDDREASHTQHTAAPLHRRTPAEHLEMARNRAARLRAPTAPLSVIRRYWNLALRRTRRS